MIFDGLTNAFVTGNTFAAEPLHGNTPSWSSDSMFNNNVVVLSTSGASLTSALVYGSVHDCYFIINGTANNAIYIQVVANTTVKNCIFDATAVTNTGFAVDPAGAVSITGCISLQVPSTTITAAGMIYSQGRRYTVEHNLQVGHVSSAVSRGMVSLATGGVARAGELASCRANIIYAASAGNYVMAVSESDDSTYTLDAVTVAGYNAFTNPSTVSTCKYNAGASSAAVAGYYDLSVTNSVAFAAEGGGAGNTQIQSGFDFTANPTFFDSSLRNLYSWAVTQGQAGTMAGDSWHCKPTRSASRNC